jgi:PTH1 family peptidyl-tRNA hydrolase
MVESDFLIAGLGNPGSKYRLTRHNIGFMAIDHFAATNGWVLDKSKFDGIYCRHISGNKRVVLLRPETYMNRSGYCLAAFVNFFKIPLANILIIHDDLDLVPGRVKVVAKGGSGGHNGIISIAEQLGSGGFCRVKAGIGRPGVAGYSDAMPVKSFVLSKLNDEELTGFGEAFSLIDRAVELFLSQGIACCMNEINSRKNKE